jgi:tricarballylate dehydrogenase
METIVREELDVIVVGAGNAATCAALSARENGARVLMLGIAPEEPRACNSAFTGGAFRVVYHGGEDLVRLIPDMNETELRDVDFGTSCRQSSRPANRSARSSS